MMPDCPGFGVNVDLVAMHGHLVILNRYYLRLEQWRDDVAQCSWISHLKKPRLTNAPSEPDALRPIFDNQVADTARRVGECFRPHNCAVEM